MYNNFTFNKTKKKQYKILRYVHYMALKLVYSENLSSSFEIRSVLLEMIDVGVLGTEFPLATNMIDRRLSRNIVFAIIIVENIFGMFYLL